MKIKRTIDDHKIIIPDREKIGAEFWNNQVVNGEINKDIYKDISAQERLQEEEKNSVIDIKLSNTKIIKLEEDMFKKFWPGIEAWIIQKIIEKLLAPGKVEEYLTIGIRFVVSFFRKVIEKLRVAAEGTETKIDDQIVNALKNGFENIVK